MPTSMMPSSIWAISIPVAGWVAPLVATAMVAILSAKHSSQYTSNWLLRSLSLGILRSFFFHSLYSATTSRFTSSPSPSIAISIKSASGTQPTKPRRSSAFSRVALAISSWVTTLITGMPNFLICFMVKLPVSISPAWFNTTNSTPWPLSAILIASTQAWGPGAAKILPATETSIMPSPTKPLIAGSWPVPPRVTMVTRSASANFLLTIRLPCSKEIKSALDRAKPSNNSLVKSSGLLINFCIVNSSYFA